MKVSIFVGDITKEKVDAIVNAANETLLGGGGVDGAIHRAAGRGLVQECMRIPEKKDRFGNYFRCDTGEVCITSGCHLPAKYVIHTVGPRCVNGIVREIEEDKLMDCWLNSLNLAKEKNFSSISFPSISTGAFLFPVDKAAYIAMSAIEKHLASGTTLENVNIVCFSEEDKNVYKAALDNLIHG
jgi:O-acetyl-ADP-ribose deacetylase (regulator of RNase III)